MSPVTFPNVKTPLRWRNWPCRCGPSGWAGTESHECASETRTAARRYRRFPELPLHYGSLGGQTLCPALWWCDKCLHFHWTKKKKKCTKIRAETRICSSDNTTGETPNAYRVTLLTYLFSSTTTLSEQARGANTCRGSGKRGNFSPGAAARTIALRLVWATPYCPACRSQTLKDQLKRLKRGEKN